MLRELFIACAAVAYSEAAVSGNIFGSCSCGGAVPVTPTVSAAYCYTSVYQTCNITIMEEENCAVTCPHPRSTIIYRNNSAATWLTTPSLTCADGVMVNGAGAKVVALSRPTCGVLPSCSDCPLAYESTACPANFTCNPDNFNKVVYDPADDCSRISCLNGATLTLYDAAKVMVPYTDPKLYCTTSKKWQNFSVNGLIASGVAIPATAVSANCRLSSVCETCRDPNFVVTLSTQLPNSFKTGYNMVDPVISRRTAQCTTMGCPSGYALYGFMGTAEQSGLNYTTQGYLGCAANGQWKNGDLAYTPQDLKYKCMQKVSPCPPIDTLTGDTFSVACNETTLVSSVTCSAGLRLSMRYSGISSSLKYDRATFFVGKGWLAHGCDGTANLFTTNVAGITAVCS